MEAHFQNPAEFRRAEDSGELARSMQLSPATLFLVALPLLVFVAMYASIAGEREDGTLRQLIASGIGGRAFFLGKLIGGLRLVLPVFLVLFVAIAAMALATASAPIGPDAIVRAASMLALYTLYLVACAAIALGVSALFRTRQAALLALICAWALMTVLAPRLAADLGRSLYPPPDARAVSAQLRTASETYYADPESQEAIRQSVLDEYGVSAVEDLPIAYGAYVLQKSEELSFPEFERVFGLIAQRHAEQNDVARALTLLTPLVPAINLSRGFAGTDLAHQNHFVAAAEAHRREMIRMLNEDYMFNSGRSGFAYTVGREVWERFRDFSYRPLSLAQAWRVYLKDVILLLAWVAAALGGGVLSGSARFSRRGRLACPARSVVWGRFFARRQSCFCCGGLPRLRSGWCCLPLPMRAGAATAGATDASRVSKTSWLLSRRRCKDGAPNSSISNRDRPMRRRTRQTP